MGREAECSYKWQGQTGRGKAVLEAEEIILRGDIKTQISRLAIFAAEAQGDDLILMVQGAPLVLHVGTAEAERWLSALRKPRPTLAKKLGLSAEKPGYLIGHCDDGALSEALRGAQVNTPQEAKVLVAMLHRPADLSSAVALAQTVPDCPIWCVYGKGTSAAVSDATVRQFMYAQAYRDSKSCAISADWTATRYSAAKQ